MPTSRSHLVALALCGSCLLGALACGSDPSTTVADAPSTTGTEAPPTSAAPGTTTGTAPGTTAKAGASTTTTAKAGATTSSAPGTTAATTTIPGTDPGTLPQTEDKPVTSGAQWDDNTKALWAAIVDDDPDKALRFFFPLSAYKQVKAISNPAQDYDNRLIAYFKQDIHALHTQLGNDADTAELVKLDVPATALWIKPGVEYNKGAYWRVFDSKLIYKVNGKEKSFLVKSMISWRGQWYVVHLSSIR